MNLVRLSITSPGTGLRQLYRAGAPEVALLTHPNLVSLFDPAYSGYQTLNTAGSFQKGANVRQPGSLFQPRVATAGSLQALALVEGSGVLDKTGAASNNNWKDDYTFPSGDFTYFIMFSVNSGVGQNAFPLSTYDDDGLGMGVASDYKPRVYTRYGTGSVLASATADFVEGRFSLMVMSYTYGDNRVKMWVDGTLRLNATTAPTVTQTVRRIVVGSGYYLANDPNGALNGKIAFAGVMSGTDAAYEPVIRAFAKARFPLALAHAV